MNNDAPTLGKVVGANVRRLRQTQEATLEDLARAARERGAQWSVSRVVAIERGAREPKIPTLMVLAQALGCTVNDLLVTDAEWVDLGTHSIHAKDLVDFTGRPRLRLASHVEEMPTNQWLADRGYGSAAQLTQTLGIDVGTLRLMASRSGLVEERTARMLDLDADVLSALSFRLWDRPLGEERDRLAQEQDRTPADVTAELREQLRAEIDGWPRSKRRPSEYPD